MKGNTSQYIILAAGMILIFLVMRDLAKKEEITAFSEMVQLLKGWLNDPDDVWKVQHHHDLHRHLQQLWHANGLRFTLIRGDGLVLVDGAKDHKEMPNHLSRPEIQDALVYGRGVSIRKSTTMDKEMIYVAEPIDTKWGTLYLRVASVRNRIHKNNMALIMAIIVGVIGMILIQLC